MQTMTRDSWTDDKMDALNEKVDLRFAHVDERLDQVDRRFDQVDRRLEAHDEKIDTLRVEMKAGFETVGAKFESLYRVLIYLFVSFALLTVAAVGAVGAFLQ